MAFLHVSQQEKAPVVDAFAAKYGLESPMLLDESGAIGRTYGLRGTPTTYFINAEGVIEDVQVGFISQEWIDTKLATN